MLWIWVLALPTYPIVLDIFSHQNIIWIHIITKQWNVQINSSLQPARAPPEETSPSWDRSHPTHIFPCLVKDVLLTLTIRDGERNSDFFHDSIKVTQFILILFPDQTTFAFSLKQLELPNGMTTWDLFFFVIVIVDDEQFDVVVDEEVVVELVEVKISHLPALLLRSVIDPNQVYDFSVYYSFSWIWGLDVFPPGSAFWPRSCQGGLEGGHHGEEDDVHGREGQQHL